MDIETVPTIWIPVTYRCNNFCNWCYAKKEISKNRDLSEKNESLFLNFFSDLNVKKIVLIGGEPTLYKEIFRFIKKAVKKDISVGMVSNGRKLSDYNFAKKIKDAGIYSTTISIEGSTQKLHDKITGVHGSFKQSLQGLENIIKLGINASTETVMSRDNEKDLGKIVKLTESYKELKQSVYSICGPCIAEERISEFSLTLNEGAKMYEEVFRNARYKEKVKLITSATRCSFDHEVYKEMKKYGAVSGGCHIITGSRFVIEPDGDIIPCVHFAGFPIMNIFEESQIISAENFLKKYNDPSGTNRIFRKQLAKYPSEKCRDNNCWGDECLGGCPIFWNQFDPSKEIKGLQSIK